MYYCKYCIYKTNDSSNMRRHVRGLHSEDLYKCEICSAQFKWFSGLKKHMQNFHSQMRNESQNHQFGKQRVVKGVIPSPIHQNQHLDEFENNHFGKGYDMQGTFDIRLK